MHALGTTTPLLGVQPTETHPCAKRHTGMFTVAVSVMSPNWKPPCCIVTNLAGFVPGSWEITPNLWSFPSSMCSSCSLRSLPIPVFTLMRWLCQGLAVPEPSHLTADCSERGASRQGVGQGLKGTFDHRDDDSGVTPCNDTSRETPGSEAQVGCPGC